MAEATGKIILHEKLAKGIYKICLDVPEITKTVRPGQFVHVSLGDNNREHILRRPLSVYDTDKENVITFIYQPVGKGTRKLTNAKVGEELSLLGPMGWPWDRKNKATRPLLVGAGLGAAAMHILAKKFSEKGIHIDFAIGLKNKEGLILLHDFKKIKNLDITVTTDDGSYGIKGFCTDAVKKLITKNEYDYCAICGPDFFMELASKITMHAGIFTEVSTDKRMACGLGACLSCVVDTKSGGKKCSCIEGPVFDASDIIWS
ncbi:MAG: dihydroorotate dehydrogenase electron transfer subunit [Eggerthellaceae bacterium]|nr:dihydroorotate dehydrogenase electron transfer subunit [Eggerthellaceae bacterium]